MTETYDVNDKSKLTRRQLINLCGLAAVQKLETECNAEPSGPYVSGFLEFVASLELEDEITITANYFQSQRDLEENEFDNLDWAPAFYRYYD